MARQNTVTDVDREMDTERVDPQSIKIPPTLYQLFMLFLTDKYTVVILILVFIHM